jgi:hypothetical protein
VEELVKEKLRDKNVVFDINMANASRDNKLLMWLSSARDVRCSGRDCSGVVLQWADTLLWREGVHNGML